MGKVNESKVDYWLSDDGLMLIQSWSRDGLTLDEIQNKIGISHETLRKWRQRYPELEEAMSKGREFVDYKVENALLKAALGYTKKSIKVTLGKKIINGETFQVLKETTTEEVGPNVTACMAWLNNRKHDQWKRNRDKVLNLDEEDNNINITIVRGPRTENELGDTTNTEVNFKSKTPEEKAAEAEKPIPKNQEGDDSDVDYWPEDWEDEEENE